MVRGAFLVVLCLGTVIGKTTNAADLRIELVESGLLPMAASKLGVTAKINDQMKRYGVPGVSVAVLDGGQLAWARGYGVADARTGERVTTETQFQAASISKPIAAVGALVLVDRGMLDLDEDVNRYLKTWKIPASKFTQSQKVTLRRLLSHTAGVADIVYRPNAVGQFAAPTLLQILNGESPASNLPLVIDSTPGERHAYSKGGYDVLQQLMIDASGESFNALMKSAVFRPLGMKHSSFELPQDTSKFSIATGHYAGEHGFALESVAITEMAAAGLWSTPSDLVRFLINIQRAQRGAGDKPVSPALTREMLKPQKGYYGLGVVISGKGTTARFGHDGFNAGFESSMVGYVDQGRGAVVMANSSLAFPLIREILDSIASVYQWPHYDSTNMWPPDASVAQQEVVAIPPDLIAASVGQYRSDANYTLRLIERNARLFIELPNVGEAEVFATAGNRLLCPQLLFFDFGSPWLQFVKDDTGTVDKIVAGYRGYAEFQRIN